MGQDDKFDKFILRVNNFADLNLRDIENLWAKIVPVGIKTYN
jgi:hypothetical protein